MAVRARHRISPAPPSILEQAEELAGSRDLFALLLSRELKVRYKQTALGATWVVLQPLVPALIFTFVFGLFARLPSGGTPYLVFALSGLVLYGLFSSAASRASSAFLRDGQLVTKVYVPRAILPLATGSAAVVDFAVGAVVLLVAMLAIGIVPFASIIIAPLVAAATLTLGLAVGLALAALSAHYRDFSIAVPFILQVLLYTSPIVYSAELVPPDLRSLYALNPVASLAEAFRWTLFGSSALGAEQIAAGLAIGAVGVVGAVAVFSRGTRNLTDVL